MGRFHMMKRNKRSQGTKRSFKGIKKLRVRHYHLSGVTYSDGFTPYSVCRNGFQRFFGIGSVKMAGIKQTLKDGGLTPTPHGLSDRQENS